MYSRTHAVALSAPQERFAFAGMGTRSREPEVFTFDQAPAQATAVRSYVPIRPKKRCTRVMYPAKVRMHLPPPEKSRAKRWLLVLCLVVLWQIYTEEPCTDTSLALEDAPVGPGFPCKAEEEEAGCHPVAELVSASAPSGGQTAPGVGCSEPREEVEDSRYEQQSSAGKSYMVALLVYHRLGSDN